MTSLRFAIASVGMLLILAACNGAASRPGNDKPAGLVIGSYAFTESRVLAAIYTRVLSSVGVPVSNIGGVASREILEPALEQGKVDLVPEYQGTALRFLKLDPSKLVSSPTRTHQLLRSLFARDEIKVLRAAPAQDRNAFVVTRQTAHRFGLHTLSDLAPVAPRLSFGAPPECVQRPLCLEGLRSVYGIHFASFQPLDAGGPLTLAALQGKEIDVGLLFTTSPAIASDRLVVLRDDRHLQPPDNVVPVVRRSELATYGHKIGPALNRVSSRLTTQVLRSLNRAVDERGSSPSQAAASWLRTEGLIP